MLGLHASGPMRLNTNVRACSRRCGARLVAPLAPCWRRPGALVLPPTLQRNVCLQAKRGRPRKNPDEFPQAPTAEPEADGPASGERPKRGRRSRKEKAQEEARDLIESQQVDIEVLEQFKARAAEEERLRREAVGDSGEDDPRRLNFHRSLLAASARGFTSECARIIDSMVDAGLPPGPRAIHVWAYSHIKIGDGPAARAVAEQARDAFGIRWIPETYVALMHGALNCTRSGPDVVSALALWVAQQEAGADPQLGFTFLAKELFRLRYSALAMQVVAEGYAAGLKPDEKLAALVIEQLCKRGLLTEARAEMQRLLSAGLRVGPEHYDTIIRLEAAGGNLQGAREMLQTYYSTPEQYLPPRASSYTALVKGLASSLRMRGGPGDDDAAQGSGAAAGGGRKLEVDPEQLERTLDLLKNEMVSRGLRPGRETYAAMVEAASAVGDLDSALNHYEAMTRAKGTPALLRKKFLGHLVVCLLVADRPIDALRVLRDCAASPSYSDALVNVTLPASACGPLPGPEFGGRSPLTAWLPDHHDVMRGYRGKRASVLNFMRDADMSSRREVDGVVLGLGGCVVTEDGLFVPPAKMSLPELRVELTAAGVDVAPGAGRKELTRMVKERRAQLPTYILEMQAQIAAIVEDREAAREEEEEEEARRLAGEEPPPPAPAAEDDDDDNEFGWEEREEELQENIVEILAEDDTFEGGESFEDSATFRAAAGGQMLIRGVDEQPLNEDQEDEDDEDGPFPFAAAPEDDDDDDDEFDADDMVEAFGDDASASAAAGSKKRRRRRRGRPSAADAAADAEDDMEGDMEEEDDEEDDDDDDDGAIKLEDAPPLNDDLLGPSASANPEDLYGDPLDFGPEVEDDDVILDQILNMSVLASGRYNAGAGMHAAVRMMSLWSAVGLRATAGDLVALYEGATVEGHPRCAADVAEQLPALVRAGVVDPEELTSMLSALALVCLEPGSGDAEQGDRVVTLMENNGLQVPDDVYAALDIALDGKPRAPLPGSGRISAAAAAGDNLEETETGEVAPLAALLAPLQPAGAEEEDEEAEEGAAGEEDEDEDEEVFADYEDDPGQLEEEQAELERLLQQDGPEDDAWLDELDEEAADVAEVRAAAAAEAADAAVAEAIRSSLAAVQARNPRAAALLAARLTEPDAAGEGDDDDLALFTGGGDASSGQALLPAPGTAGSTALARAPSAGDAVLSGLAGGQPAGDSAEATAAKQEAAVKVLMESAAAEAEWDVSSIMELPPDVLAEAAEGAAAELGALGMLTEEDAAMLSNVAAEAKLLAELAEVSKAAAQAHPDGPAAAAREQAEAVARIARTQAAAKTANELAVAAFRASERGVPLPELPEEMEAEVAQVAEAIGAVLAGGEDEAEAGEGEEEEGYEDEDEGYGGAQDDAEAFYNILLAAEAEAEEARAGRRVGDEGEGEEGEEEDLGLLRLRDLKPAVDDGVLGSEQQERLEAVLEAAEELLQEEEERQAQRREELGEYEEDEEAVVVAAPDDEEAQARVAAAPAGQWEDLLADAADEDARAAALEAALQEAAMRRDQELTPEEQTLYDLLEADDVASLGRIVGREGLDWLAADLRHLAEEGEIELDEATRAALVAEAEAADTPTPATAEEASGTSTSTRTEGDDLIMDAPELMPGMRLSRGFMERYAAVLRERADLAATDPDYDPAQDSAEAAMLDALVAMANGYKLAEEREEEEAALEDAFGKVVEAVAEEEEDAASVDPKMAAVRRDLARARRMVQQATTEAEAAEARVEMARALQRQGEVMEKRRRAEREYDEDEEEEYEEYEEGEEGVVRPRSERIPPELARQLLAAWRERQPGAGSFFVAPQDEEEEWGEEQQEGGPASLFELTAARLKAEKERREAEEAGAGAEEEESGREEATGGRGRGRGRGGAGRGRRGAR